MDFDDVFLTNSGDDTGDTTENTGDTTENTGDDTDEAENTGDDTGKKRRDHDGCDEIAKFFKKRKISRKNVTNTIAVRKSLHPSTLLPQPNSLLLQLYIENNQKDFDDFVRSYAELVPDSDSLEKEKKLLKYNNWLEELSYEQNAKFISKSIYDGTKIPFTNGSGATMGFVIPTKMTTPKSFVCNITFYEDYDDDRNVNPKVIKWSKKLNAYRFSGHAIHKIFNVQKKVFVLFSLSSILF
jgi:hypothetical protein